MKNLLTILFYFCSVFLLSEACFGQQSDTINDPYADNGYMQGRLYYAIRSGQVKMMVQADKVGTSPAFSYLLFDAQNPANSKRKNRAYNYTSETKFFSSVLRVRMKDFAFAPLGSTCSTRWIIEEGIPSVEATWWASGFSVREILTPIGDDGSFRRRIVLKSSDLVAKDSAFVQLQLPEKAVGSGADFMLCRRNDAYIGIRAQSNYPVTITDGNTMEIGPIVLSPGDSVNITSYLLMDLNPSDKSAFILKLENIPASDEQKTRQLAEKWQRINQLQTPDQVVSDLYRAASYSLHGVIGDNGVLDAGPFEYGAQWVRDASLTALGLIHTGDFELSRRDTRSDVTPPNGQIDRQRTPHQTTQCRR
jgi:hypothetical protein